MLALVIWLVGGGYITVGVYDSPYTCTAAMPVAIEESASLPEATGVACIAETLLPPIIVARPPIVVVHPHPHPRREQP